jgi:hypothetical protein
MKNFNERWQLCAAHARQAPSTITEAPPGFVTRVLIASERAPGGSPPLELAWQRLTWRCLAGATMVLILCAALEMPHLRDQRPLEPGIENTVAQLIWSL